MKALQISKVEFETFVKVRNALINADIEINDSDARMVEVVDGDGIKLGWFTPAEFMARFVKGAI